MQRIEVTLSRMHKIAERLKSLANEANAEALRLGSAELVSGKAAGQVERLKERAKRALDLSRQGGEYTMALATVRAVIGAENARHGISDLLAKQDAVNQVLGHARAMLAACKEGTVLLSELESYQPLEKDSAFHRGIQVRVMGPDFAEFFEREIKRLQREAFGLSDKIAEANARRVQVDLPKDIAETVLG